MSSIVDHAVKNQQFVQEEPATYDDDPESDDSELDDYDDDDPNSPETPSISVQDLLGKVLDDIKESDSDLTSKDRTRKYTAHFGDRLTEISRGSRDPTALHILAATKREDLPDMDKLGPLVDYLVRHKNNLLSEQDDAGRTPLNSAIYSDMDHLVERMCLAHNDIDSILFIPSHQQKNCLHIAIEKKSKMIKFLVDHAKPNTLCAKDKNGNTPLHLAVKYEQCTENQLPIVAGIVEKCDHVMQDIQNGVFNDASQSPYRYHLDDCKQALEEKKRKYDERRKAKKDKERVNASRQSTSQGETPAVRIDGLKGAKPSTQKLPVVPSANVQDKNAKDGADLPVRQSYTRIDSPPGKRIPVGQSRELSLRPPAIDSPTLQLIHEHFMPEANDEEKTSRKTRQSLRTLHAKRADREKSHHLKVTEENVKSITGFLKLHYLRERGHDAALEILYGPQTTSDRQIYFDLSGYTTISRDKLPSYLQFEDILQYVIIPNTRITENPIGLKNKEHRGQVSRTDGDGRRDYVHLFEWLREKNVKTVLKVIVDDSAERAHSDDAIEEALENMGVEIWDWRKQDLCSEVIFRVAPNVRVVHLYWSGNNAVLRGWSEEGGLKRLTALKKVYMHVRQGLETRRRTEQSLAEFRDRMKSLCRGVVIETKWPEASYEKRNGNKTSNDTDHTEQAPKHEWLQCMKHFSKLLFEAEAFWENDTRRKIRDTLEKEIKVALIDDGINIKELQHSPAGGRSFCSRGEDGNLNAPFYESSGGHGTVMASQIYRICPRTQLYVFKLEDNLSQNGVRQINPRSAAQAIRAAVSRKVDIISMSWTIGIPENEDLKKDLQDAILDAAKEDILMFCSATDRGPIQKMTFPSNATDKIFTIGAAGASGVVDSWVGDMSAINFTFPGNKVESEEYGSPLGVNYRTGSSVATALAAGLAALILYCVQIRILRAQEPHEKDKARRDFKTLKKHYHMMKAFENIGTTKDSKNKYIAVWEVFGKRVSESENCGQDEWIDLIASVGSTLCMKL